MPEFAAALPRFVTLVVCAPLVMGCTGLLTSSAPKVTRAAVPAAIDESLNTFDEPATRRRVAELMGTPEMQRAAGELGGAAVDGAVDGASSTRSEERLSRLTAQLTDTFTRSLAEGLENERGRIRATLDTTAAEATHAASRAAADELRESIGPAVRESLVTALRSPDLRAALDETVMDATTSASRAVQAQAPHERPLLERLHNLVTFAWLIALGVAIALAILFVRALRGRWRAEARRRAIAQELVSNAIEATKEQPWANELRDVLTNALADLIAADQAEERAEHVRGRRWRQPRTTGA
jgi:hypothetical protein